jgi:fatty acid CoA ligase FadD9
VIRRFVVEGIAPGRYAGSPCFLTRKVAEPEIRGASSLIGRCRSDEPASPVAAPTASWTPNEAWLFAELARRAVVASLDGAPARRASSEEDDPFHVEIHASSDAIRLVMRIDAANAVVALEPIAIDGSGWRERWALELGRRGESWILERGRAIEIDEARREPISVELRVRREELAIDGERIPLADAAFHKHTRQSSIDGERAPLAFAPKTASEPAPWWEIDLGKPLLVARMRIALTASLAAGAKVRLTAYTFAAPGGGPPPVAFERELVLRAEQGELRADLDELVPARLVRICVSHPAGAESVLEVRGFDALAAEPFAATLRDTMRRAFAVHRDRTLFLRRTETGYEPAATYGEIRRRALALARSLAGVLEPPVRPDGRVVLAVVLPNRPEWILCDLAAIERRWVIVPLAHDDPDDRLANVLGRVKPDLVVCEAKNEARLRRLYHARAELVVDRDLEALEAAPIDSEPAHGDGDLYTILFTSGSTGAPKGAMRSYATVHAMIESYGLTQWPRHLSFQPLSHLSERMVMPWLLVCGATIGFSRGGVEIARELAQLGPTELASVPRLYDVLYAQYRRRLRALVKDAPETPLAEHEALALREARAAFGPRLRSVAVGSAPVSAEVLAFMRRCFADLWVTEGYGSTEVGTIAVDDRIAAGVDVKLVPLSGAPPRAPGDPERGEIWVRSKHVIDGYLGDEGEAVPAVDAEGYFATGDLGERAETGRIKVIGRLRNAVKLAQGEFVSAERIESALATVPGVDRIYAHVEGGAGAVSALVFGAVDGDVLSALRAHGRGAGLLPWEIPRGVLVEPEPPTIENGLLTASGKLARGAIAARYGAALSELASGEGDGDAGEADVIDDLDLGARIERIARRTLGRAVDPHAPLDAVGVDSLAAAEIMAAVGEELGREVPLATWFEASSLCDLSSRLGRFAVHGSPAKAALVAEDRARTIAFRRPIEPGPPEPRSILLTGATGFLGSHLVEALLARTHAELVCLVRADDDAAAGVRLASALARYEIARSPRVRATAFDLAGDGDLAPFASVDLIVHSAAVVSWLASYEHLRRANVHGTLALLELGRPMHFVSTISTAPAGGDESTCLSFDAAAAGSPYGLTKWIAEEHARKAAAAGLPVAIYRPGMIAAHSRRGHGNPDDFVHRYLAGVVELGLYLDREDATLDMTPVDYVADAIALLVAAREGEGDTHHLVNVAQSMSYAGIGRAIREAGYDVAPASYEAFRGALLASRRSRLRALAPYFPESGFSMAMGPWPSAATGARLAKKNLVAPVIDAAMIARVMARLAPRT